MNQNGQKTICFAKKMAYNDCRLTNYSYLCEVKDS